MGSNGLPPKGEQSTATSPPPPLATSKLSDAFKPRDQARSGIHDLISAGMMFLALDAATNQNENRE
jgi:hypothetical protein